MDAKKRATVWKNGIIYTVDGARWAERPAESLICDEGGELLYVGTNAGADTYVRAEGLLADEIDLDGKTVLPGFIDTHVHMPGSALTELYEIYIYRARTKDETLKIVRDFIEAHPGMDAYFGNGFLMGIGEDTRGPRKEWLDEICADKPIILGSSDGHSLWLNSMALESNGIFPGTVVPPGGNIPIDAKTGELWGIVTDCESLVTMVPTYDDDQQYAAMKKFQETMLRWGYTGAMLIAPHFIAPRFLKRLEDEGLLRMKLNISGLADPDRDFDEALDEIARYREQFADSDRVRVRTIKYFADGVVEGSTAYLSEPYDARAGMPEDFTGCAYWDAELLKESFGRSAEHGLQIHVHSIGDAATEEVIDAMAYAQTAHPDADSRNVITHLQLVKSDDRRRMGELKIIGSLQPFWHFKEPDWHDSVDAAVLGEERAYFAYPTRSLVAAGVKVTFSGDYPVSSDNNPFWAIEAAVTRNLNNPEAYGVAEIDSMDDETWLRNPDERVSLADAIEAYTINGAYQLFREDEIGSLRAGKCADFVIIDRDIFRVDPIKLDETQILDVVADGRSVLSFDDDATTMTQRIAPFSSFM
ncbi:MAG: amidohydrolase [Clostridiales Family XIII bacterium]|nr:amidohydrolase [Clostridiales Family XIII bacterium]